MPPKDDDPKKKVKKGEPQGSKATPTEDAPSEAARKEETQAEVTPTPTAPTPIEATPIEAAPTEAAHDDDCFEVMTESQVFGDGDDVGDIDMPKGAANDGGAVGHIAEDCAAIFDMPWLDLYSTCLYCLCLL